MEGDKLRISLTRGKESSLKSNLKFIISQNFLITEL